MVGMSLGSTVGPYLIDALLEDYGWRGTLLILSAIIAHRIPLGMTMWLPTKMAASRNREHRNQKLSPLNTFVKLLRESTDFSLFKDVSFFIFCIASILQTYYVVGFLQHLPSFMIYKGHTLEEAAFLMSIMYICNIGARLIMSFVSNMKFINHLVQYAVGILLGSLAVVPLLTLEGYAGLITAVALFGIHLGRLGLQVKE